MTYRDTQPNSRVENKVAAIMNFPDERLASFVCGFGQEENSHQEISRPPVQAPPLDIAESPSGE